MQNFSNKPFNEEEKHEFLNRPSNNDFQKTTFFEESLFNIMLMRERKRTERTRNPFILVLLDLRTAIRASKIKSTSEFIKLYRKLTFALSECTRATDTLGWYRRGKVIGIMFTEIKTISAEMLLDKIKGKIDESIDEKLTKFIHMTLYCFPDDSQKWFDSVQSMIFYPESEIPGFNGIITNFFRRLLDITVSTISLILFSPVILLIAVAIKIDSNGPVFFRQERIGYKGKRFILYKFRSMHANNDSTIHKNYVKELIKGKTESNGIYKITDDPRVTKVGRILRRSSLDELPQLYNILKGDMSVVGPRPALEYETEVYELWHRTRVACKPGLTGKWQIEGRSSTSFDNMVRMDLGYISKRSLLTDVKIMFRTPWALLTTKGAY